MKRFRFNELFGFSIHDDEMERRFASKSKIVDELVQTEMDYFKVMKTVYDVYLGPNSDNSVISQLFCLFCFKVINLIN